MMSFFRRGEAREVNAQAEAFKIFGWWFLALVGLLFYLYADKALNLYPIPIPKHEGLWDAWISDIKNEGLWEAWISDIKIYRFSDYLLKHWYYFLYGIFAVALLSYACFRFFRQSILTIQMLLLFFILFFIFLLIGTIPIIFINPLDKIDYAVIWLLLLCFALWRLYIRYPDLRQERLRLSPTINARAEAFEVFGWLFLYLMWFFTDLYAAEVLRLYPIPKSSELREIWISDIKNYNFSDYLRQYWYYFVFGILVITLLSYICFRYCKPHKLIEIQPLIMVIFMLIDTFSESRNLLMLNMPDLDFSFIYIVDNSSFFVLFIWLYFFAIFNTEKFQSFQIDVTWEQMYKFSKLWTRKLNSDKKKLIADELEISTEKTDKLDKFYAKQYKIRLLIIGIYIFGVGFLISMIHNIE